jgi:hypothetical protein
MSKLLFLLFLFFVSPSFSQNIFIKKENKLVELSGLKNLKIHQYKLSFGKDSIYQITEVDSLYKKGDTLVVRPWVVEETHYLDPVAEINIQRLYKPNINTFVKIPIIEIDKITGKKRSISRPMAFISVAAFIGVASSMVLRAKARTEQTGNAILLVSAPTLVVCWTLQTTVAKKRYHFDKNRTNKKVWVFN